MPNNKPVWQNVCGSCLFEVSCKKSPKGKGEMPVLKPTGAVGYTLVPLLLFRTSDKREVMKTLTDESSEDYEKELK